jgi:hypothetical protein
MHSLKQLYKRHRDKGSTQQGAYTGVPVSEKPRISLEMSEVRPVSTSCL